MDPHCIFPKNSIPAKAAESPATRYLTPVNSIARIGIIVPNATKAGLLAYFCSSSWGFAVVAVETTGTSGIAAVTETKPELVMASLTPVDWSTSEYIAALRRAAPASKLALLSTQCNECLLHSIRCAEYHALIYEPDETLQSIHAAVAHVRRGGKFVSTRMRQCEHRLRTEPSAFPKLLSTREQQVLACIALSLSDEEIAMQLKLSAATALAHRRNLMHKLGIHSTPKLIRYCMDKGFDSFPPISLSPGKTALRPSELPKDSAA